MAELIAIAFDKPEEADRFRTTYMLEGIQYVMARAGLNNLVVDTDSGRRERRSLRCPLGATRYPQATKQLIHAAGPNSAAQSFEQAYARAPMTSAPSYRSGSRLARMAADARLGGYPSVDLMEALLCHRGRTNDCNRPAR